MIFQSWQGLARNWTLGATVLGSPFMTTHFFINKHGEKVAVVIPMTALPSLTEDGAEFAAVAERRDDDGLLPS